MNLDKPNDTNTRLSPHLCFGPPRALLRWWHANWESIREYILEFGIL